MCKEMVMAYFKVLSQHSSAESEENHEIFQSGHLATWPQFERGGQKKDFEIKEEKLQKIKNLLL
jgi:hypothetical protein